MTKWLIDSYCEILCWAMDHTDPDGWLHYHIILLAEATTPNDW